MATSVLKICDPPLTAVGGREVTAVRRYGAFLALATDGGPYPVTRPARSGCPGHPGRSTTSVSPSVERTS
ncbi:hypothetical protein SUDANB146_00546 [Streptomyces sp. enrichment culture]